MRPALNPALRPLWRDEHTLQLGLDPGRAVVVEGVRPALSRYLLGLDGRDTWVAAVQQAAEFGIGASEAEQALQLLRQAGALVDRSRAAVADRSASPLNRERLGPDLAAWSVADRSPDATARTLARRTQARIDVLGAGRVGAAVAHLLVAAGVGEVTVVDEGRARAADVTPGGLCEGDVGQPRGAAVEQSIRRLARTLPRGQASRGEVLTVLCPVEPHPDGAAVEQLVARGVTHLLAVVVENVGAIGPLVQPGRSPCLRCLDLHRTDRDPQWPLLVAQLAGRSPRSLVAPCDVALAATVSGQAALAVLAALDAPDDPHPLLGAVVELDRRGGESTRRTFGPHPNCGCLWTGAGPGGQHPSPPATMGT